ncbi:MAG: homoserine O-acetyltransferase, partial [Candidatus Caenarcaniphilales bacterium]|nr:homoserine O-acetyltransferase [Candidatus Caenarcaniphilales bacterium]
MIVTTQFLQIPLLKLECGVNLPSVTIAYETYGSLNQDKSNVVLVCHALTGDAHAAGKHKVEDTKPGWWDKFIGPGKAIDTNKYFVISSNVIGGCSGSTGPKSIDPQTRKPYGLNFPFVTIKDMVKAQALLLDSLDIEKLYCCIGGSMGGMQALEWAFSYPERCKSYVVLAASAYQSPQNIALHEVGRRAIMNDPNWQKGNYYGDTPPNDGLSVARMIAHISYLSDASMHKKFGRRIRKKEELNFELHNEFEVESYLEYQGRSFIERFDANSYLYITRA